MKMPAKTVGELITALQQLPPDAEVVACWESQTTSIEDVIYDDGKVMLDVDGGWLRDAINKQKEKGS